MASPVVLITGALSGIGRATAFAFARDGARVVVSGRHTEVGDALVAELATLGAEALFVKADVRHEHEVCALVDQTVGRFGRLDVAINNAGTEGTAAPLIEQTPETFAAMFETNVLGVLLSMKHELLAMRAQGSGSIVNISSTLGQRGAPGVSLYAASKHAVEGLTKVAALEVASVGIRVNAVAPGPVETDMLNRLIAGRDDRSAAFVAGVPLKRLGTADEIARSIVFIASEGASFITGAVLSVNGGKTAM